MIKSPLIRVSPLRLRRWAERVVARPGRPSPPLLFDRSIGAAGAVERVELCQVLASQPEIEDLAVLSDSLTVRRLRDHRDLALDAPAEEHLRRCPPEPLRDSPHRPACE